jgi:hypothetical protein
VNAEEKLRARIRNILSVAGADNSQALSVKEVEDGIIELFREYSHSPKDVRGSAYVKGKRGVLKTLRLQSLESSK